MEEVLGGKVRQSSESETAVPELFRKRTWRRKLSSFASLRSKTLHCWFRLRWFFESAIPSGARNLLRCFYGPQDGQQELIPHHSPSASSGFGVRDDTATRAAAFLSALSWREFNTDPLKMRFTANLSFEKTFKGN